MIPEITEAQIRNYLPDWNLLRLLDSTFQGHVNNVDGGGWYYRWLSLAVKATQPKQVLELGTYLGVSALMMYMELPAKSTLTTVDKQTYRESFIPPEVHEDPRFRSILGDCMDLSIYSDCPKQLDFLFIDTDPHTEEQIQQEWNLYKPLLANRCLVVLDDIGTMRNFWETLRYPKIDLTQLCHLSGFGAFQYETR
jgi:hypothetical protein